MNINKSEVYGNILDHELNPKENVLVEAYHVAYTLPPIVPLRYFLGMSITNQIGKFRITFPTEAYGVIDKFRAPNIELRVSENYQILLKHPIRFLVIQNANNNFGDITIPAKFVYSDEIDHVDLKEEIETYYPDISDMPLEEVGALIPQYLELFESMKYGKEKLVKREFDYRGMIVPKRPKTTKHTPHKIPWYENWEDEYDV